MKVLVTDTQFIFEDHVKKMNEAGIEVIRLKELKASAEQLKVALKGVDGYILGGIEEFTEPVLESTPDLKAVVFTGSGFKEFIPCYREALARGVRIAATSGANANAVAEYVLALILLATFSCIENSIPLSIVIDFTAFL